MTTNGLNHSAPRPFRVAIIGAGIAGLSAALSLRHFFPSQQPEIQITIYEKAARLREIGASIALNPSGLRILDKLGVEEALSPETAYRQPSGHPMVYLHWLTSEIIAFDEYKGLVDQERHSTARFHRAQLQRALLRAVEGIPHVDLRLGARAKNFDVLDDGVTGGGVVINFEDGSTAEADLLIGADGIHSKVRGDFAPEHQLRWTGQVALRATFDTGLIRDIPNVPEDAVHIVGHDTTMFASYLGNKNQFTIVGNYFCDPQDKSAPYHDAKWDGPGDVEFLKDLYKEWGPLVRSLVSTTPYINTYPNYAGTPLPTLTFSNGRVVLLGDAAHTHGGAFAAGGSLAINDAYCLAMALAHVLLGSSTTTTTEGQLEPPVAAPTGEQLAQAATLYDETRRPLVTKVLETVHGNARAKREAKEQRAGRRETDDELRARVARRPNLSWLAEHDVVKEFRSVVARLGY